MAIRKHLTFLTCFCLPTLLVALAGCDQSTTKAPPAAPAPTPTTPTSSPSSSASTPVENTPPPVDFASIDAGVTAFKEACASREGDRINETMRWLSQQGNSAIAPLGTLVNDSSAEIGTRVAATRTIAIIGTDAATTQLLKASHSEESLIRTKAAESLGSLRPATPAMLDRLLELLDDKNQQVQSATIRSIERLGPQAKRAAPKLQAMLNSDASEQLRQEAHDALKKVAPRVGFRQGELD